MMAGSLVLAVPILAAVPSLAVAAYRLVVVVAYHLAAVPSLVVVVAYRLE